MKKIFMLITVVLPLFLSCSSDNSSDENIDDEKEHPSIVGVWENGSYFVSFSNDGYYAAYLGDQFIDSGNYTQSEKGISCSNPYFNRTTSMNIENISVSELKLDVTYTDVHGDVSNKVVSFRKSTDIPASQNSSLTGKSLSYRSSTFGVITMKFNTGNSGVKTATKGAAAEYPIKFFYIFINGKVYYQYIPESHIQVPTIGSWTTDYYDIYCRSLTFSPNGEIDDFDLIDL